LNLISHDRLLKLEGNFTFFKYWMERSINYVFYTKINIFFRSVRQMKIFSD
jgi:hypothetical protein